MNVMMNEKYLLIAVTIALGVAVLFIETTVTGNVASTAVPISAA
jgi:hypothetical protein